MAEGTAATALPAGLGAEAVSLLQRLIRADTVNPPGNERPLQEELAAMSSRGRHLMATKSGHWIPLDQPELVVAVIQGLHEKITSNFELQTSN